MVGAETNGFLDSRHHKFCRRMSSLDLPEGLAERIIQCNSSYTVRFGVRLRGRMYNFIRARSIANTEPVKSGICYASNADAEDVEAPATPDDLEMLAGRRAVRPLQGALKIDPSEWTPQELERIIRRFTQELNKLGLIGPGVTFRPPTPGQASGKWPG
ncbi:Glu/Leu/Phe/Val dehydrogenase dimerization domain-containing protein [Sinorhizobium meliloti]|nr:Glu/Leu/Phe/Val dehydrogenase dimerization domain-containing protein [Sinorhizobium meliloti]